MPSICLNHFSLGLPIHLDRRTFPQETTSQHNNCCFGKTTEHSNNWRVSTNNIFSPLTTDDYPHDIGSSSHGRVSSSLGWFKWIHEPTTNRSLFLAPLLILPFLILNYFLSGLPIISIGGHSLKEDPHSTTPIILDNQNSMYVQTMCWIEHPIPLIISLRHPNVVDSRSHSICAPASRFTAPFHH